jgi:hypothetical protein
MSNHPNRSQQKPRPREHLEAAGKMYPKAWSQIDEFRAGRGKDLPMWPDWCFAPLAAWYSIVSADAGRQALDVRLIGDVGRLAAIGAWRVTQGIYRFDPALYEAIIATPVDGDLPCDVLYRLPEWCAYIETQEMSWADSQLYGVFVHLEWDANTERHELRLLMDSEAILAPLPLHIGAWSLKEAVERMSREAATQGAIRGMSLPAGAITGELSNMLEPIMSLILYLCSANAEISTGARPTNPEPKRTKNGWRLFPADKPKTWDVGVRIGAALRRAYHQSETGGTAGQDGPRPHIRRAHWHGYWKGPRNTPEARKLDLKWLPPIAVNVEATEDLVPVVRPIKE